MNILVSNDDGVYAEGIVVLAHALQQMGHNVRVIAPDRNRSGASNSLTLNDPLRLWDLDNGFTCVVGTPTDCVHLAVTGLLEQKPDMVIAGINSGANLGDDILYSGTVAAAMEGRVLGFPAMAISLAGSGNLRHYATAIALVKTLIAQAQNELLPQKTILNINVPDVPLSELQGIRITRLGARHIAEPVVKTTDPRGRPIYWIGPAGSEQDAGPGTDFDAVNNNFASITPLQLDLTDHAALLRLSQWVSGCKS